MKYIVGDIHGEITKLEKLIHFIEERDAFPEYIFIGDYLDKGENVKAVLDYLIALSQRTICHFLIGNHEYYWMQLTADNTDICNYLEKYGGRQTIRSFAASNLLETQHLLLTQYGNFFSRLQPFMTVDNYFIVHSGIPARYLSTAAKDIPLRDLLFTRYDFISSEQLYQKKYKVIFGHTGFYTPYADPYKISVDTAACFLDEQPLTAFCPDQESYYNSDRHIQHLADMSSEICPNIVRKEKWKISS